MTPDDVLSLFRLAARCSKGISGSRRGCTAAAICNARSCSSIRSMPETLARALAERVRRLNAQTVLSPALGGIVIGQEVARALGAIFAERQDACSRSGVDSRSPRPGASSSSRTWSRRRDRLARPSKSRARQGVGRRRRGHHRSRRGPNRLDLLFEQLARVSLPAYGEDAVCKEVPLVKPGSRA